MVKQVNQVELEELIQQKPIVIVDFSAVWCGPCKSLGKILEDKVVPKLAGKENIELVKVDIDENRELANALQIQGVPTMMFFYKGKRIVFQGEGREDDRIVGLNPKIDEIIFGLLDELEKNE